MSYNIVLLCADQHRGDWLQYPKEIQNNFYDNDKMPLYTPNFCELLKDGTTFFNAITPSPLCAPARACLALGTAYYDCPVKNNDINMTTERKTFYNILGEKGYNVYCSGILYNK